MKPRQQSNLRRSSSLLAVSFAMSLTAAHATALTWDGADTLTSGAQGGAGTWNVNTTANWWNGTADQVWPVLGGTNDDAIFANTAGTVTLAAGGVTANDLTFSSTGYLIESNTLTLNGTTPTITTDPGVSATISSIVAGSAGLVKNGSGTLTLSGAQNTYSGDTTVNAGTLVLQQQRNGGTITTASGAITEWKLTAQMSTSIQSAIIFAGAGRVNKTGNFLLYAGIETGYIKVSQSAGALFDLQAGTIQQGGGAPGFISTNLGSLNVASGALFSLYASDAKVDALTGSGTVETSTWASTLTVGAANHTSSADNPYFTGNSATFSGVLSNGTGSVALVKTGSGTQVLSGINSYSGGTTVTGGTLKLDLSARSGEIANLGAFAISASANLEILSGTTTGPDTTYFASGISFTGAGTIIKTGTGYVGLGPSAGGVKDFAGLIDIQQGILANHGTAWSTGAGAMDLNIAASAMFDMRSGNVKIDALSGAGTIGKSWAPDINLSVGNNGGSATFSGVIGLITSGGSGTISLTKNGSGTQTLTGSNSYTGGTTVSGGILQLGDGTTNGAITGNIANTANVTFNNASAQTFAGNISGSGGSLTKSGAGTLALSGINSYTGGTTVNAGTLKLDLSARSGAIANLGTFTIGASANLEILSGNNTNPDTTYFLENSAAFTGTGTITKTGTGYLGSGANVGYRDFAGLIDIQQGILANHGTAWSTGAGAMDLNIAASAMLDMRSGNVKIDALSGAGTIGKSYSPDLNLSLGNNGGSATFSGVISQTTGGGTGSISLTKTGTGTQILSGASTYSGGTTVSNGTLLVNNTTDSGTGSGAVTVSGGILGGTGSIAGAVTLNGGTLAPGASIESLTTGALTMNTGTTFAYEMNSTAGSYAADLLVVTSGVALNGTVQLGLTDVLGGAATRFANGTILTLINYASSLSGGFFYGETPTLLGEGDTFSAGLNTWKINYNAATGGLNFTGVLNPGSHFINLTAIPEPGSLLALGCLVGSGMLLRSRRRK
jgi:autotransporter-associated beta strand protein